MILLKLEDYNDFINSNCTTITYVIFFTTFDTTVNIIVNTPFIVCIYFRTFLFFLVVV